MVKTIANSSAGDHKVLAVIRRGVLAIYDSCRGLQTNYGKMKGDLSKISCGKRNIFQICILIYTNLDLHVVCIKYTVLTIFYNAIFFRTGVGSTECLPATTRIKRLWGVRDRLCRSYCRGLLYLQFTSPLVQSLEELLRSKNLNKT